eukprot:TRINITY_DN7015_c0_g1_i2.p1 TRINITY_DN7015_c0_g1~~TRINITY_DN7015_c0_g1_i2.p1  ORF type:complete len:533 (-),score=101.56 TRINITY_DN7015_c0_g1_i2:198-1796(-)
MALKLVFLRVAICTVLLWSFVDVCYGFSYRAGVFQHSPVGTYPYHPIEVLKQNFEVYRKAVVEARDQGVDIVVFPEGGTGWLFAELINTRDAMIPYCETIPDEASFKSLCDSPKAHNFSQVRQASCMAQRSGIVVVVNMCVVQYCDQQSDADCPSDGRFQWNTDVVFDENGLLIAAYRKSHLFGGGAVFDQPTTPDVVSFNTTFGVQFGMFICYDIDFFQPVQSLLAQGIENFVFSSAWVNTPPLQTAVQLQQAWSRVYQSNLLAANSASDYIVSGGGIYSSGLVLNVSFSLDDWNIHQLLVADVPISPPQIASDLPPLWRSEQVKEIQVLTDEVACHLETFPELEGNCVFVQTSNLTEFTSYKLEANHTGLSCSVDFNFVPSPEQNETDDVYALFVARGNLVFPNTPDGLAMEVCAFLHCHSPPNCSSSYDFSSSRASLGSFKVALQGAEFSDNVTIFPLVSVNNTELLPPTSVIYNNNSQEARRQEANTTQISFVRQEHDLFAVVLYGVGAVSNISSSSCQQATIDYYDI